MSSVPATIQQPDDYYHFQLFKEDLVFKRRSRYADIEYEERDNADESKRGEIKAFSKKSKFRLMHQMRNSQHHFKQFITLTYPKEFPTDGRVVKEHLNALLTRMRQVFGDLQYMWVFEAQTRGAPHFHIIINAELPNQKKKDRHGTYFHSETWSRLWSSITGNEDNPKHLRHGLRIDPITDGSTKKLASYMAKYYTKNEQKSFGANFSGIGRFWGASRGFAIPIEQGVYLASELKWMLKLCFHYANLERARAGYGRYNYSVDRGCSIWNFTEIFRERLAEQFSERLDNPFNGYEEPPKMTLDQYRKEISAPILL